MTLLSVSMLSASWVITTPEPTCAALAITVAKLFSTVPLEVDDVVSCAGNRKVGDHVVPEE